MRVYFDELADGFGWLAPDKILVVWAYYDESGEYDANGVLLNMSVGGCVSPREKWASLETAWRGLLEPEGLFPFHMTDFEAWKPPFNFTLPDGSRDRDKHNRVLNGLLCLADQALQPAQPQ